MKKNIEKKIEFDLFANPISKEDTLICKGMSKEEMKYRKESLYLDKKRRTEKDLIRINGVQIMDNYHRIEGTAIDLYNRDFMKRDLK